MPWWVWIILYIFMGVASIGVVLGIDESKFDLDEMGQYCLVIIFWPLLATAFMGVIILKPMYIVGRQIGEFLNSYYSEKDD